MRERTKHLRKGFGERLRNCREGAGLTLEEFSKQTDFSAKHLGEMEEGLRPIPAEWLTTFCWILGVTLHHMIGEQKALLDYAKDYQRAA